MIYIQHGNPPQKLDNKFNNPNGCGRNPVDPTAAWSSFRGKDEIRAKLIPLQYGLCAYCENSLDTQIGAHIEHIKAKSPNPSLTFEYINLILSCFDDKHIPKGDMAKQDALSCGHHKRNDDNALFIKPTEQDCDKYFKYEINGEIMPNDNLNVLDVSRAEYTIKILNLNCNRLVRERKSIYQNGLNIIAQSLGDEPDLVLNFLTFELMLVNGNHYPYINLRKQLKLWYESFI